MPNRQSDTESGFQLEDPNPPEGLTFNKMESRVGSEMDEELIFSSKRRLSHVHRPSDRATRIQRLARLVSSSVSSSRTSSNMPSPGTGRTSEHATLSPTSDSRVVHGVYQNTGQSRRDPDPYATPDSHSVPHYIQAKLESGPDLVGGVVDAFSNYEGTDDARKSGSDPTPTLPMEQSGLSTEVTPMRKKKKIWRLKKLRQKLGLMKKET